MEGVILRSKSIWNSFFRDSEDSNDNNKTPGIRYCLSFQSLRTSSIPFLLADGGLMRFPHFSKGPLQLWAVQLAHYWALSLLGCGWERATVLPGSCCLAGQWPTGHRGQGGAGAKGLHTWEQTDGMSPEKGGHGGGKRRSRRDTEVEWTVWLHGGKSLGWYDKWCLQLVGICSFRWGSRDHPHLASRLPFRQRTPEGRWLWLSVLLLPFIWMD